MSAPHGPLPSTVRTFLFGADSVAALVDSFVEVRGLDELQARVAAQLGEESLDGFRQRLATAVADFMNVDPATVMADGLRKHRELRAVAEQTAASGASALVPLGTRRLSLTQRPSVEVELEGSDAETVGFELALTIDIAGVAGIVRGGALVELEGEYCELNATFTVLVGPGGELLAHQAVAFDGNLAVPLDGGIKLA